MPEESVMRAGLVLFVAAFGLPSFTAADDVLPVDSVQKNSSTSVPSPTPILT